MNSKQEYMQLYIFLFQILNQCIGAMRNEQFNVIINKPHRQFFKAKACIYIFHYYVRKMK